MASKAIYNFLDPYSALSYHQKLGDKKIFKTCRNYYTAGAVIEVITFVDEVLPKGWFNKLQLYPNTPINGLFTPFF